MEDVMKRAGRKFAIVWHFLIFWIEVSSIVVIIWGLDGATNQSGTQSRPGAISRVPY